MRGSAKAKPPGEIRQKAAHQWQSKRWDEIKSWRPQDKESRKEDAIAVQKRHNEDEKETIRSGKW